MTYRPVLAICVFADRALAFGALACCAPAIRALAFCAFAFRAFACRAVAFLVVCALAGSGCGFSERSFPFDPTHLRRLDLRETEASSVREWVTCAHRQLSDLLPARDHTALLTEDMTGESGEPVDVLRHFGRVGRNPRSIFGNYRGFLHSVQSIGAGATVNGGPAVWAGFEDVWIPVSADLKLAGRIGYARDESGRKRSADCIVIIPGIFGDSTIMRTRDLAFALRRAGLHALVLELRGHGRTDLRYPDTFYQFGVAETTDLLKVSEWLETLPEVSRTGLIGYCWGANHGMLAAWYDGKGDRDPSISAELGMRLPPVSPKPHFRAGIIAFSPVLRCEAYVEELETPKGQWGDPVLASIQQTMRDRSQRKHHPTVTHSLRKVMAYEFARSRDPYDHAVEDAFRFLRFLPFRGEPAGDKLRSAQVPLLLVHGCNDLLSTPQDIADLMVTVDNPNVAAIVLPGGGHVGFAAYARDYTFNLVINFFDPRCGVAAKGP